MSRESPKCKNCGKVLEWLPWKNGKPQRPVDPATKKPCECWKTKGKNYNNDTFNKTRFLKAKDYTKCLYCDGYYETEEGNEMHEKDYHKDKKIHRGEIVIGESCFEDEILNHAGREHWYMKYPDEIGDFLSVDGKENVREFVKKHGIKVIRDKYLLD